MKRSKGGLSTLQGPLHSTGASHVSTSTPALTFFLPLWEKEQNRYLAPWKWTEFHFNQLNPFRKLKLSHWKCNDANNNELQIHGTHWKMQCVLVCQVGILLTPSYSSGVKFRIQPFLLEPVNYFCFSWKKKNVSFPRRYTKLQTTGMQHDSFMCVCCFFEEWWWWLLKLRTERDN